jgi:antitoxin (DNA-binding transcriptional repressor) of toxin-antitoxin stability system
MHKVDVSSVKASDIRTVLRGNKILILHKGKPLCAIIPLSDLILLEGLQLEELEAENTFFENIF